MHADERGFWIKGRFRIDASNRSLTVAALIEALRHVVQAVNLRRIVDPPHVFGRAIAAIAYASLGTCVHRRLLAASISATRPSGASGLQSLVPHAR
jgi:hypothetical protein